MRCVNCQLPDHDGACQPVAVHHPPEGEEPMTFPIPIDGGFHIKDLPNGLCIDVIRMIYNWRVVLSENGFDGKPHGGIRHGYCYFGFGQDADGKPRTMDTAFLAATVAAMLWDGEQPGPLSFDKQAC